MVNLRECPRSSRKKPNLDRSPTGSREAADVNSHMPCRSALPCCAVALRSRFQSGLVGARQGHGMARPLGLGDDAVDHIISACPVLPKKNT
jgi:hypothetical protein